MSNYIYIFRSWLSGWMMDFTFWVMPECRTKTDMLSMIDQYIELRNQEENQ